MKDTDQVEVGNSRSVLMDCVSSPRPRLSRPALSETAS